MSPSDTLVSCPRCKLPLSAADAACQRCGLTAAQASQHPAVGQILDGRYRILELLGEGGMGLVFKAEQVRIGKICAVKLVQPQFARMPKAASRFLQEATLVSKLSSPHTVQVFDFGELSDGTLYLVMEYLSGYDLRHLLKLETALSEPQIVELSLQLLASLAEAHEQGIIHRDLKPENAFLVQRKGAPPLLKLLDFGIAKLTENAANAGLTGTDFVGTPSYMSPEQVRAEPLDRRSDLYSLGAMMYELATGHPPFDAPSAITVLTKHLSEPVPHFGEHPRGHFLSPRLEKIVLKALAKDPAARFASAEEMREALLRLRSEQSRGTEALVFEVRQPIPLTQPVPSPPPTPTNTQDVVKREDIARFERNLRVRKKLVPLLVLSLLAVAGGLAYRYGPRVGLPSFGGAPPVADGVTLLSLGVPHQAFSGERAFLVNLERPTALSVRVGGIVGADLSVELAGLPPGTPLRQPDGGVPRPSVLATIDDGAVGAGEFVDGVLAGAGPLYVKLIEKRAGPAANGASARFSVLVDALPPPPLRAVDVEAEPNEPVAQRVDPSLPVRGFTGAFVPLRTEGSSSAVDLFTPGPELSGEVGVIVVTPAQEPLFVLDPAQTEQWASDAGLVSGEGVLALRLLSSADVDAGERSGAVVRIQPSLPGLTGGKAYYLAFATPEDGGFLAVDRLAEVLRAEGRTLAATVVRQRAEALFGIAPVEPEAVDAGPPPPPEIVYGPEPAPEGWDAGFSITAEVERRGDRARRRGSRSDDDDQPTADPQPSWATPFGAEPKPPVFPTEEPKVESTVLIVPLPKEDPPPSPLEPAKVTPVAPEPAETTPVVANPPTEEPAPIPTSPPAVTPESVAPETPTPAPSEPSSPPAEKPAEAPVEKPAEKPAESSPSPEPVEAKPAPRASDDDAGS